MAGYSALERPSMASRIRGDHAGVDVAKAEEGRNRDIYINRAQTEQTSAFDGARDAIQTWSTGGGGG